MAKGIISDGHDVSLDEISKQVVDIVFSDTFLKREALEPRIRSILKVFLSKKDRPRKMGKPVNDNRNAARLRALMEKDFEQAYWKAIVKDYTSDEEMKVFYNNLNKLIEDQNF